MATPCLKAEAAVNEEGFGGAALHCQSTSTGATVATIIARFQVVTVHAMSEPALQCRDPRTVAETELAITFLKNADFDCVLRDGDHTSSCSRVRATFGKTVAARQIDNAFTAPQLQKRGTLRNKLTGFAGNKHAIHMCMIAPADTPTADKSTLTARASHKTKIAVARARARF